MTAVLNDILVFSTKFQLNWFKIVRKNRRRIDTNIWETSRDLTVMCSLGLKIVYMEILNFCPNSRIFE